jgi:peroxiredoxin
MSIPMRSATTRTLRWLAILALAVIVTTILAPAIGSNLATAAITPASTAPDFTLRVQDGPNLRLKEQRGRVVLVNFWASWCGPCRREMPQLSRLYDKYRAAGFLLLGVSVDDDARKAAQIASKLGVTFPVLFDSEKSVSRLYDLSAMPSTVLIDRDGRVRYVHRGYKDGYEQTYDQ